MQEQFTSYEIALKLKKLGFDKPCFKIFDEYGELNNFIISQGKDFNLAEFEETTNSRILCELNNYSLPDDIEFEICTAPLYQQVFQWFREKHNIIIEVWYDETQVDVDGFTWLYEIYVDNITHEHDGSYYDNFYECREGAILKAIELCQEK